MVELYLSGVANSNADGRVFFSLFDVTGSAALMQSVVTNGTSGNAQATLVRVRLTPAAGSRTYKAQWKTPSAGTGTVFLTGTPPFIGFLRIYAV